MDFIVVDSGTYNAAGQQFGPGRHLASPEVVEAVELDGLGHVRVERETASSPPPEEVPAVVAEETPAVPPVPSDDVPQVVEPQPPTEAESAIAADPSGAEEPQEEEKAEDSFQCVKCERKFANAGALATHTEAAHAESE